MKKLFLSLIFVSQLLYFACAAITKIEEFEQKFKMHQENFPIGNLQQISYIKQILDYMFKFDQEFRIALAKKVYDKKFYVLLNKIDTFHTIKMKKILITWGWITISKFGHEYDNKAWLLIQHADLEPFFQIGVLWLLENIVNKGETDKKNCAYLYDRIALKFHHLGMRQRYGTQLDINSLKLQPYEGSLKEIDERRKKVGLEPLKEYINKFRELLKK